MLQYDNCPNCFHPLGGNTVCGRCSFDINTIKTPPGALPLFCTLNSRYVLGRVLGKGGFGITYIAQDFSTNRICAIKEYMPSEYASRDGGTQSVFPFPDQKATYVFEHGKSKFIEEAKTLLRMSINPIVVNIWDYFTQNNTAYIVMEFLDGQDLRKLARSNGGTIEPDFAKNILVTIASSLMEIHRMNILHRDLSPENIIVTKSGQIKLIDFGAARNFVSNQNKGMSILLKPGFAPPEQYHTKGVQGPWSDVYALCATFYNIVSGKPLVDALFRSRGEVQPSLYSMGCAVTEKTSQVIEKGMELDHKKRYQDFKQLMDDIDLNATKSPPNPGPMVMCECGNVYNSSFNRQSTGSCCPKCALKCSSCGIFYNRKLSTCPKCRASSGRQSTVSSKQIATDDKTAALLIPFVTASIAGRTAVKSRVNENDIFKIGRSRQSSHMALEHDTNISRVHCYIRYDRSKNIFYLSDVSVNGTYLEGGRRLEKNKEYALQPGAKFYLASKNNLLTVEMGR